MAADTGPFGPERRGVTAVATLAAFAFLLAGRLALSHWTVRATGFLVPPAGIAKEPPTVWYPPGVALSVVGWVGALACVTVVLWPRLRPQARRGTAALLGVLAVVAFAFYGLVVARAV